MLLETLILQTHLSNQEGIEAIYAEILHEVDSSETDIRVYFGEDVVLNVAWHVHHCSTDDEQSSELTLKLKTLLQKFGAVQHRVWTPYVSIKSPI